LPAIQAARQSALRNKCRNNIRQMAIATQSYLDSNKAFPFGGTKPWPIRGENKSWAFQILPYLEEAAVYGFSKSTNINDAANKIAQSVIPSYSCPTRRQGIQSVQQANNVLMDYCSASPGKFNATTGNVIFNEDDYWQGGVHEIVTKKTNHRGIIVRKTGTTKGVEVFVSLANSPCKVKNITDGLSKTLLIGEKKLFMDRYDGGSWYDDQGWADGWDPDVVRITSLAPEQDQAKEPSDSRTEGFRFGSAHPVSMNACMADSAVIGINYEIDVRIFNALGDRADGKNIPDVGSL